MTPMRIDVNLAEWPTSCTSPSEEQIQVLKERLSSTPTKDPEAYAQKTARTALLHKLELEAKTARAKRASDLVKENKARKLRMEAAAVARAASKIEKATKVESTRRQEHEAKREAATARRAALFEAVRAAREARQNAREARQAELSKLETNAASLREKKLASTVSRSSAQVKHALQVAASLKEKEKTEAAAAATRLADRLSAASHRRQDALAATIEGAASVGQAAEKVRLRHLYLEKAAIEERRHRLTQAMHKASGRREAALESITSRVAAENARVADVVADARLNVTTLKPTTMRHALAVRLQAAEVRRLEALKKPKSTPSSRGASREVSPKSSPTASPSKTAPTTPWSAATPMLKMHKPEPVIVISTEAFHFAAKEPSSRLLSRLQFRPRMLLATAPARHAAAAGRRQTRLNLIRARASHFGTVRVAVVRGRCAAVAEFSRALFALRVQKSGARAAAHLRARASVAARFNERVNAAKVKRSSLRLGTLNAAIAKEEKRLAAADKRTAKLTLRAEGKYRGAKAFAFKARRTAATERLLGRGAALHKRCLEASARRDLALAAIVARARRTAIARARRAAAAPKCKDAETVETVDMSGEQPTEAKEAKANLTAANEMDAKGTDAKPADANVADAMQKAIKKAAEISAAGAARAEARAEAKQAARESAKAVKSALEDAAAMAGLQGHEAKKAACAGKTSSAASSVASSDSEDWHVVPTKM